MPEYNKNLADFLVKIGDAYAKKNLRTTAEAVKTADNTTVQAKIDAYDLHVANESIHTPVADVMLHAEYNVGSATVGAVQGLATLDTDGLVPVAQIPVTFKESAVVSNIESRNALTENFVGRQCYVIDATADPSVESGGASYIVSEMNNGVATWHKTNESESMDVVLAIASHTVTGALRTASSTEIVAGTDSITVGGDTVHYAVLPSQLKAATAVATETSKGTVILADNTKAVAGTGSTETAPLVITTEALKFVLDGRYASDSTTGLVRIATTANVADRNSITVANNSDAYIIPNVTQVKKIVEVFAPAATNTLMGQIRIATDAEAVTGTNVLTSVNPKQLKISKDAAILAANSIMATETTIGTVELASNAEAIAGIGASTISNAPLVPTIQGTAAAIDASLWTLLTNANLTYLTESSFSTTYSGLTVGQPIRINYSDGQKQECKVIAISNASGVYTITISGATLVNKSIANIYESKFSETAEVAVGTTATPPTDFTGLYYVQLIEDTNS